jgi:hypothetical protein
MRCSAAGRIANRSARLKLSTYRFLQDASVGQIYYQAGTVASTADVGGTLPVGWVPPAAVDPLDAPAATAFFNAGPQLLSSVRTQWTTLPVALPLTYWVSAGNDLWQLTGLGAGLGVRNDARPVP